MNAKPILVQTGSWTSRSGFQTVLITFSLTLLSCLAAFKSGPQIETGPVKQWNELNVPDVRYRPALNSPREMEILLQWQASNIRLLSEEEKLALSDSLGIPTDEAPHLYLWTAEPIERSAQMQVSYHTLKPDISRIVEDRFNGNRLRFWDFSDQLQDGQKLQMIRRLTLTSYELDCEIDSSKVGEYNTQSRFWKFYTKSEAWLTLTPALTDTAKKIVGEEKNAYLKARNLYRWLHAKGIYVYPPKERGAIAMLETLQGDCGQFSYLFIALCRAVGIPARLVAGFRLNENDKLGHHAWAECFLPNYGWVPADLTTEGSEFGRLDNRRVISSVGMNIILPDLPKWANYKNSGVENGVTDFMQFATVVKNGFAADITSEVKVLKIKLR